MSFGVLLILCPQCLEELTGCLHAVESMPVSGRYKYLLSARLLLCLLLLSFINYFGLDFVSLIHGLIEVTQLKLTVVESIGRIGLPRVN